MLTINRPFYEYRDIYLFIAVGLAAFITTFIVLGVITTSNINQLSRSGQESGSSGTVQMSESTPEEEAEPKSSGFNSASDQSAATSQSGDNAGSYVQSSRATQPEQPSVASVSTPNTPTGSSNNISTPPATVVVSQPAPTTPKTPITSNPQQPSSEDGNLINVKLPLGIALNLL